MLKQMLARSPTARPVLAGLFMLVVGMVNAGPPTDLAWYSTNAESEVGPEDLRPGLVTIYRDPAGQAPVEVVQLEPMIAVALKPDEASHPRLASRGGTIRWEGYLTVLRPGVYQFSAVLRGRFRLTVAGKEVLAAEVTADMPVAREGPKTQLTAGNLPLVAEFTRPSGVARVQLFWQAPYFRKEPLSFASLSHLPAKVPDQLAAHRLIEQGRYLAEERSCGACHQPAEGDRLAKGLTLRQGPDLSEIGRRAYPGWIFRWLEAPQEQQPGTVMPRMFSSDESSRVERYAVARYLASLGGPLRPNASAPRAKELEASMARGRQLFSSIGCVACHHLGQAKEVAQRGQRPALYGIASLSGGRQTLPLQGLGSKTTPEKLAEYLTNPLAVDPSGRMPHLLLQRDEARDLARFLCASQESPADWQLPAAPGTDQMLAVFKRVDPRPEELAAFQRLPADAQWVDLGKRLVIDKGCNNCHTIAPGGQPFASVLARASFDDVKQSRSHDSGCLAADQAKRGQAPVFGLDESARKALGLFLKVGTNGAGSPAPGHAARVALERFNCLACHSRDGEGGLAPDLVEELRRFERAENAEAVSPPPLTGVGHKLRTPWLRQVLTQAGRARPWMGLRMPQFGAAHVGRLPEALAALEGAEPDDTVQDVALTPATIEVGRQLAGKGGFGCVSCHDVAGLASSGTRGPDLALMTQRVRFDWYRRWLEQPQRFQPGTRMPTVFPDGKSLLDQVLGGSADAQAEAMWAYCSLGMNLPLPEGLEPPKGLVVTAKDRPVLVRTFLPDAGSRALAVGYPEGMALAFDAAACRLAYAWTGNFLDASPAWSNRGGAPSKVLGPRFWTAPAGCPWGTSDTDEPPDFAARARNPAFGASVPEGQLPDGPRQLGFEGYAIDKSGLPTFRYVLDGVASQALVVSERPVPLRSRVAHGLARQFALELPARRTAWLLAGEASREPRALDSQGNLLGFDLKPGLAEFAPGNRFLVLPQGDGRVTVLGLSGAPDGTRWRVQRHNDGWQALVRLPRPEKAEKWQVSLSIWVPYRDEPGLLKALLEMK